MLTSFEPQFWTVRNRHQDFFTKVWRGEQKPISIVCSHYKVFNLIIIIIIMLDVCQRHNLHNIQYNSFSVVHITYVPTIYNIIHCRHWHWFRNSEMLTIILNNTRNNKKIYKNNICIKKL